MHAPRKATEWNRCTLMKAKAICVVEPETDFPEGAYREVRLVLAGGMCSFKIYEAGVDANVEVASGRTWSWNSLVGPTDRVQIDLLPTQTIWAMISNQAGTNGLEDFSVIVQYKIGRTA